MTKSADEVKAKIHDAVRRGYVPYWGPESAEDHGVDWQSLSRDVFEQVLSEARRLQQVEKRYAA